MKRENDIFYGEKRIERALSHAGAQIAKATGLASKTRAYNEKMEKILLEAQYEISELYEALSDYLDTK